MRGPANVQKIISSPVALEYATAPPPVVFDRRRMFDLKMRAAGTFSLLVVLACGAFGQDNDVEVLTTQQPTAAGGPKDKDRLPLTPPGAFLYGDPFFPVVLPLSAPSLRGVVQLKQYSDSGSPEGALGGDLILQQFPGGPLLVTGNLTGLPPGKHALSVHALGDLRKGCESLGPIFDGGLGFHNVPLTGGPPVLVGSAGDLGNLEVGADGTATVRLLSTALQLCEPRSVLGRGFIVREKEMDYRTADLGKRVVCGVAGIF